MYNLKFEQGLKTQTELITFYLNYVMSPNEAGIISYMNESILVVILLYTLLF